MSITNLKPEPVGSYELLKIILEFIGTISWPLVILIIVIIFRDQFRKIISHARKVELPGGVSFEMDKEIQEIKELGNEIKKERKPERQVLLDEQGRKLESEANKRMVELGLKPSPSGLDLDYYKNIANSDPRLALIGLRADLEIMLRNLAYGFKIAIETKDSISKIISKLYSNNAIDSKQFDFINRVFNISNSAAHGGEITKLQAYEIIDIGQVLVDDYIAWLSWGF